MMLTIGALILDCILSDFLVFGVRTITSKILLYSLGRATVLLQTPCEGNSRGQDIRFLGGNDRNIGCPRPKFCI